METFKNKIAVIGMACRFPGAKNLDAYWENLVSGKDTIKHFSIDELLKSEVDHHSNNKDYVKARGILNDVDKFDADFFGMTPGEAAVTDPQHRVWLETAWEALENAGCNPFDYPGSIAIFAGGNMSSYLANNIQRTYDGSAESTQMWLGNDSSFIPTKTAYNFNLRGPAIYVQTACSTSLVAIAQACQSLFSFESDICMAGGITISVPQEKGYLYQEGGIHSPDGLCRTFDAQSQGTVFSNGVGIVILKRMEDAIADHDRIYAVVDGWAINNDGSNKMSYTAPSVDGQAEVIMMAQSFAEISPEEVGYIEAHGTATVLGDPIEIAALTKVFASGTDKKQFCGIGSVKSNIGHADSAAGVASFIKACLSVYYKKIPASLHYQKPNPHIDFANSPFYVLDELKDWKENKPLIIGVSSFGIGGTNAHLIVEEPPVPEVEIASIPEWPELLVLSAKSEAALERRKQDLTAYLKVNRELNLHDVSGTLAFGRKHMLHRSFIVASSAQEIISGEKSFTDGKINNKVSKIAFMFPGQGAQYYRMGSDLYQKNKIFREILDECFQIVGTETGENIKAILFDSKNTEEAERRLSSTEVTQTVLFIIEYALSKVLGNFDIKPDYLVGHSIGEYTAACLAGVFDLESALKIVIKRGQLMRKMPSGEMMAVKTEIEKLRAISDSNFEIAADNAPGSCTISFKTENNEEIKALLDKHDIQYIPLNTSHAFHSSTFDPIVSEFQEYVDRFSLKTPQIPFISCLTGTFITDEQATSGSYWASQLRNTVLFRNGIKKIAENEGTIFLEVGPNTHLGSLARQSNEIINKDLIISTLGKSDNVDESYKTIAALGRMFNAGFSINFNALLQGIEPRKISLPTYPFERQSHWIEFNHTVTSIAREDHLKINDQIILPLNDTSSEADKNNVASGQNKTIDQITDIWKVTIGREKIDADDDFFKIGGHSLLALQILNRIKEKMAINVSLKDFLNNPTIKQLGAFIDKQKRGPEETIDLVHLTQTNNLLLTRNQKRLWLLSQLQPDIPSYIIPLTYKLKGSLNREVFEKSLDLLFRRHHTVFSVIKEINGEPFFSIETSDVDIKYFDFSGLAEDEKVKRVNDTIVSASTKPFNLNKGPLYRIFLIRTAIDIYYFHLSIHHIIFDGWSMSILVNDLDSIYNSLLRNNDTNLEKLDFQQYDYALWEYGSKEKEESVTFWGDNLKECSSVINFPYDSPRKEISTGRGSAEPIKLTSDLSEKLRSISGKENSSLFATLMSVFGILLHKYSGEDDLNIGLPLAYRPHTKLEKIFGMFVNTVVVRLRYNNMVTFREMIRQTEDAAMKAIAHQDLPFESIVEIVKPDRTSNVNPLFQLAFAWQNNLDIPLELDGIGCEIVKMKERAPIFDLTLYLWENGEIIEGEIEYSTDLLKEETILRLRDNFIVLLGELVGNPDKAIDSLPILSDADKILIERSNDTKTDYPKDRTIAQLFEEQARIYPDNIAVVFQLESLTYKQLNEKTNQLARTLRKAGVTANTPVGILAEKSLDIIVGILGILKAGGAYVPIDPDYPEQRINYIVSDSGCSLILTQKKYNDLHIEGVSKINLNSGSSYHRDKSGLRNINTSSDLAYIMYTSGSTGRPKGSMIRQYGIARLVRNTNYLNITAEDRVLLTSAIVFDVATFEIWGALLNGGSLYIVEKETILNPKALGKELSDNNITILWLTSALLTQIAEVRTDIFSKLKYLLAGGDVLSAPHINKIRRDNPGIKIINGYGPTENTTFSTAYLIEKDFDQNVPIGLPLSNSTAYIFDKYMNYQPVGVIGELYVGGDGVSKGYCNRDDLNEKSFMAHPQIIGERLYRTGDYARWLPDGNIEFHGRMDNQIKIRGFRVELGEIESVISELEGVIETIIKPLKGAQGDYKLIAFMNVSGIFLMEPPEIGKYIKTKLPPYMVPSAYKFMHGFPKTINGKIDRKALVYDITDLEVRPKEETKSLTQTEKVIFNIWRDALKTNDIVTTDNFFDIGGNSIMAISVFSKIINAFNIDMGLRIFFDSPSIKALAESIEIFVNQQVVNQGSFRSEIENSNIIKGEI